MSNTDRIRQEIYESVNRKGRESEAYLAALLLAGGEFDLIRHSLEFTAFDPLLAEDYCNVAESIAGVKPELIIRKPFDGRKKRYFVAVLSDTAAKTLLTKLKIMTFDKEGKLVGVHFGVPEGVKHGSRLLPEFLKGLFLWGGRIFLYENACTVQLPLHSEASATEVTRLFSDLNLRGYIKENEANETFVINLKARQSVLDFLGLVGATKTYFEWTDKMIVKDMNNRINRQANCEAANADKEAMAAVKQANDIQVIVDAGQLPALKSGLKTFALYRIENPSASIETAARELNLSKSGIYHRIRRISEIADKLRREE